MKLVPRAVTLSVGRNLLKFKKDSPHIFFVAGVTGTVVSTVLACRATLKLSETLDDIQNDVNSVKELSHSDTMVNSSESEVENKKDAVYVYAKGGLQIAKLYAPAVIVGAASITMLTGSHIQMSRRNASLMAAYAVLQKAYDEYRDRVRESLGEERELDLYRGIRTEIDDNGVKSLVQLKDPSKLSPYSKIFDEYSRHWEKDPELNRLFVTCQQNYLNHLLQARGHVFLNEVYDALGIDRTKAGAVVGWVMGQDGDNFIDFGLYDAENSRFINGWERSIVLDFNVDGVIYDKI
jgi:hypothetical protein